MLDIPLLETTAELSIALAGFVGIFLVLATRDGRFMPKDAASIRIIVSCSMAPAFYAVFPLIASSLGLREPELWRVSSGVIVVAAISIWISMMVTLRKLSQEEQAPDSIFLLASSWLLGLVSLIAHFANVFSWPWPASAGLFLLAVWSIILIAALHFVNLIFTRVL